MEYISYLDDSLPDEYLKWNEAISEHFFDGRYQDRPLYLHLERKTLKQISSTHGLTTQKPHVALAAAVRGALVLNINIDAFSRIFQAGSRWSKCGQQGAPPYVALLATLTLAAEGMLADSNYAAHNYYARLYELLGLRTDEGEKLKKDFPSTRFLWAFFNAWLDSWDGELGIPTAKVFDRRVNVGLPISQVIVSEQDRIRLREMFYDFHMLPGHKMSRSMMEYYIGEWLGRSNAPSRMKRMWASSEARKRIITLACVELEAWKGRTSSDRKSSIGAMSNRLQWAIDLRIEPLPVIDMYLGCYSDDPELDGKYSALDNTDQAIKSAFAQCMEEIELTRDHTVGLLSLEPWSKINVSDLLAAVVRLSSVKNNNAVVGRSPSPVISFFYDSKTGYYREVSKLQLLQKSLLLVNNSIKEQVERFLNKHARPGYKEMSSDIMKNLPSGWCVYIDVYMLTPADDGNNKNIACLCAIDGTTVEYNGGLQLGDHLWHSYSPPEVAIATMDGQPFEVRIKCINPIDKFAEGKRFGELDGVGTVYLKRNELLSGDYDILINKAEQNAKGTLIDSSKLKLRTANNPNPSRLDKSCNLGHQIDDARGLISADSSDSEEFGKRVVGAILGNEFQTGTMKESGSLSLPSKPLCLSDTTNDEHAFRKFLMNTTKHNDSCALRGYHIWLCPKYDPKDKPKSIELLRCKNCENEQWYRSPARSSRKTVVTGAPRKERSVANLSISRVPTQRNERDYDLLLDALSYLGAGNWPKFSSICSSICQSPYFAWRAAKALSALGHIDLEFDRQTYRIKKWYVTPPCFAETIDGSWVLSGARSEYLVNKLSKRVNDFECDYDIFNPTDMPKVYKVSGADYEVILDLADSIDVPAFERIAVSHRFSERLAASLPKLCEIVPHLPLFRPGLEGAEFFNLRTGRWDEAASFLEPGAYRVGHYGKLYGYLSPEYAGHNEIRIGDVLTVKYLAAADSGISMVGYDETSQSLFVPLGGELPGILDRLATMCSGFIPSIREEDGFITYGSISPSVAAAIQLSLGI